MDTSMQQSEYENIYYSEDKMWWYVGLRDILLFYIKKFVLVFLTIAYLFIWRKNQNVVVVIN